MKRLNTHLHPLAVLAAQNPAFGMASLSADLTADDNGWYQLLPAGKFKSRDGRPHDTADGYWDLDADSAAALIAATKVTAPKVLIDYDHATLNVAKTGEKAPAAAWLKTDSDIEWREGKGLYIRPSWTKAAQKHIDEKEYAFLSAVFPYDKQGRPLLLRMAAITNDPGLVGLDPVAKLAADVSVSFHTPNASASVYGQTGDHVLNELLKQMLEKLGITLSGDLTQEQQTAALSALDALQTKANSADGLEQQVATLSAKTSEVDLSKYVPIEAYNGVVGEMAVLKAGSDQQSLESLIADAKKAGKVVAAEESYLTNFGKQQGVAALSAMLESRPAIAALSATQTDGKKPKQDQKDGNELSVDELAVLKATGLTKEQYLATKNEEQA